MADKPLPSRERREITGYDFPRFIEQILISSRISTNTIKAIADRIRNLLDTVKKHPNMPFRNLFLISLSEAVDELLIIQSEIATLQNATVHIKSIAEKFERDQERAEQQPKPAHPHRRRPALQQRDGQRFRSGMARRLAERLPRGARAK